MYHTGSWCDGRDCRELNPVEQNLTLLNQRVQRLEEEGLSQTRIIMPAYRDTHWCRAEKRWEALSQQPAAK